MRKKTEELWKEAGFEQTVSDIPAWEGYAEDFETFRRLCIENERECAKPYALIQTTKNGEEFIHYEFSLGQWGAEDNTVVVFTFPPADTDRDSVIEECARECECAGVNSDKWDCAAAIRALKSQLAAPDPRDEVNKLVVMGFWEEEYPQFTQGLKWHEMVEPLTAEQANNLVSQLRKSDEVIRLLKEKFEHILCVS